MGEFCIRPGQLWRDADGRAVVVAVVQTKQRGKWAVLQRVFESGKYGRPFLFPPASMLRGDDGWVLIEQAP